MADVSLSSTIRSNLLSLQNTTDLVNRTQNRLATGLRVASAVDDAVSFFQSKVLGDRARDLGVRKNDIDQGISSLKAAINGLETVERLIAQMKGVVLSAKSSTDAERSDLTSQFNTLSEQLNLVTTDATYQGLNLVNSTATSLKVQFSDASNAFLTTQGVNVKISTFSGLTAGSASHMANYVTGLTGGWTIVSNSSSKFDSLISYLESAITTVRSNAKTLGTNVALLQTRADFTKNYIATLKDGSDKLVLADLNEEGANLVALQTRQQLSIQALSFAGQSESSILSLFR